MSSTNLTAAASALLILSLKGASCTSLAVAASDSRETILFLRHGEKPEGGLGQLNCQGLNRALALPAVLKRKYGRIDAVFAPNPSQQKPDGKGEDGKTASYDYVRPLATVEPTAIAFALPVHTAFGYSESEKLKAALLDPTYHDATILVAWEHHALNRMVPDLVGALGGDPKAVIAWERKDFDTIWRVTIRRIDGKASVVFSADRQGLDHQPEACPG